MSTTITQQNIAMAQFKFALIAPVIQELYPDASRIAYYRRVTKEPLKKPDGTTFRYNGRRLTLVHPLHLSATFTPFVFE
jgi:hypothetical protein